jgi:hypothetical protein
MAHTLEIVRLYSAQTQANRREKAVPPGRFFVRMRDGIVGLSPVPSLLGRVVVKRFQTSSIGPVVMSVAGSALLFGIGTQALP